MESSSWFKQVWLHWSLYSHLSFAARNNFVHLHQFDFAALIVISLSRSANPRPYGSTNGLSWVGTSEQNKKSRNQRMYFLLELDRRTSTLLVTNEARTSWFTNMAYKQTDDLLFCSSVSLKDLALKNMSDHEIKWTRFFFNRMIPDKCFL